MVSGGSDGGAVAGGCGVSVWLDDGGILFVGCEVVERGGDGAG